MKAALIQRSSTYLLQAVTFLVGFGVLAFMLIEPHFEGRNAGATFFEIYFKDGFLAYMYTASIALFVALYKAFMLLRYVGQNKIFSVEATKALRTIQYCALVLLGFIGGALGYLNIVQRRIEEDIAGGVAMCLFAGLLTVIMGTAAAVFEKVVQRGIEKK